MKMVSALKSNKIREISEQISRDHNSKLWVEEKKD
jgi:hypothetical protein